MSRSALVLTEYGKPLTLESSTPPPPPQGTATIQVLATTVRPYLQTVFATGKGGLPFPLPLRPGGTAVGRITAVGPDAVSLRAGQLVLVDAHLRARDDPDATQVLLGMSDFHAGPAHATLFKQWEGTWATAATFPLENLIPLDEAVLCTRLGYTPADLEQIGRLAVAQGGLRTADVRPGDAIVVAPATGHHSGAVVELAAQIGCRRVVGLVRAGSKGKLAPLTKLYPDRVVEVALTGDAGVDNAAVARALALTDGAEAKADAFVDLSPPEATPNPHMLTVGLAALRHGGTAALMGIMGPVPIDYMSLVMRGITITGRFMYTRRHFLDLINLIEAGIVRLGARAGHSNVDKDDEGNPLTLDQWEAALAKADKATAWGEQVVMTPVV